MSSTWGLVLKGSLYAVWFNSAGPTLPAKENLFFCLTTELLQYPTGKYGRASEEGSANGKKHRFTLKHS